MSWDSYNASVSSGIAAGLALAAMTPEERAAAAAREALWEAEEKLRLAQEALAVAQATAERLIALAQSERDARIALCDRAEAFLVSAAWQAVDAEARRVRSADTSSELLGNADYVRETAALLSSPSRWRTWAEQVRSAATKRKTWWQNKSDADIIRIKKEGLAETLSWLEAQVREAPAPRPDFLVRYERGQGKVYREGWVITPEGEERLADEAICDGRHHVADRWFPQAGELLLLWEKHSVGAAHEFTVVEQPATITSAQREAVKEILDRLEGEWAERRGMSGTSSPTVGLGWLHPETGESLAYAASEVPASDTSPVVEVSGDLKPDTSLKALAARFQK